MQVHQELCFYTRILMKNTRQNRIFKQDVYIVTKNKDLVLYLQDFDLAFTTLEMLFVSESPENKPKVKSALGRVFLQLGKQYELHIQLNIHFNV